MGALQLVESVVDLDEVLEKFTYKMYPGRVAVKEIVVEKTLGGLVVPDAEGDSTMRTNEGIVIGIGEGVDFCGIGDRILYGRYSGAWFNLVDEKFRIMNEKDIIAIRR